MYTLSFAPLTSLACKRAGVGERHDLVVVTLNDQRRDVHVLQILGVVRLGERLDAEVRGREPAIIPCSQNESRTPSEILAPGRL